MARKVFWRLFGCNDAVRMSVVYFDVMVML